MSIVGKLNCKLNGHSWGEWRRSVERSLDVRYCPRCDLLEYREHIDTIPPSGPEHTVYKGEWPKG